MTMRPKFDPTFVRNFSVANKARKIFIIEYQVLELLILTDEFR